MSASHRLHSSFGNELLQTWQSTNARYNIDQLVYPVFVLDILGEKREIESMPGQYQWSVDRLDELLGPLVKNGLKSILIFGVVTDVNRKDNYGSWAATEESPVIRALTHCRKTYPKLYLIADVCLCQYTSHGHCGIMYENMTPCGEAINNEASINRLATIAIHYANAGANMVAPSDMMDGRISAIKKKLWEHNLERQVSVMAYSAKFVSCLYGPFRDAAHSAPGFGNRSTYQLPCGARDLGIRALIRDANEGADFLMIKPASLYLDIIRDAKERTHLPIACYQVSGEYAMLWHAAQANAFDLKSMVEESFQAMCRSGASIIISYFVPFVLNNWK